MADSSRIPWEIGSIFICSKCGAKFNQPDLAEEVKSEVRKLQKEQETQTKVRVIVSGCLGVCYPEKQTIAYMPIEGKTELFTEELKKETLVTAVKTLLELKISENKS